MENHKFEIFEFMISVFMFVLGFVFMFVILKGKIINMDFCICDFERENLKSEICVCDLCVCICDYGLENHKSEIYVYDFYVCDFGPSMMGRGPTWRVWGLKKKTVY